MAMRTRTDGPSTTPKGRPGRPRTFDTEQVLDAALEVFWTKGFANTTTRDLEIELSINQSSIYNAFGSKARLLEAALDRYEALTTESLITPLENDSDGMAAIETFFKHLTEWVTKGGRRGCMLINMMAEDGGRSDAITARTRSYRKRVKSALNIALVRAAKKCEIRDADIDARTTILFGLVLGLNIAARGRASDEELLQLADAVRLQLRSWQDPTLFGQT